MNKKLIFNPNGNDSLSARHLIGGNSTNLINLNNVKYKWASRLYDNMLGNFWIPSKIDLTTDDVTKLTNDEFRAYKGILSFLIFLDSAIVNNLPNFNNYITAPEVSLLLAVQTFQEAIHSQSYAYIIESNIPAEHRNDIYEYWRTDDILLKRITYIAQIFQDFNNNPNDDYLFKKALIANYILEGIYFYNGFIYFYNLASRNRVPGTADTIKLINRDELSHCVIFAHILKEIGIEEDEIYPVLELAVQEEINWSNHIIKNILGQNNKTTEQYTKWLANKRLKHIGLQPIYDNVINPYKHLEKLADLDSDASTKSNFFEANVTSYNMASMVSGWDKF